MKNDELLKIGTCSWKYDSWIGLIYTETAKPNYLREYSNHYKTVEIDEFIKKCPSEFNYALESRNPNYLKEEFFSFLQTKKIYPVLLQGYNRPWVLGNSEPGTSGAPLYENLSRLAVGVANKTVFDNPMHPCALESHFAPFEIILRDATARSYLDDPTNPTLLGGTIPGYSASQKVIRGQSYVGRDMTHISMSAILIEPAMSLISSRATFNAPVVETSRPITENFQENRLLIRENSYMNVETSYFNMPVIYTGQHIGMESMDYSGADIKACKQRNFEELRVYGREPFRVRCAEPIKLGVQVGAIAPQALSYAPWARIVFQSPGTLIYQPIGTRFFFEQQQVDRSGYVRFLNPDGMLFKKNGEIVLKAMQADQVNPYKQDLADEIAGNIERHLLPEVFASDSVYQTFTEEKSENTLGDLLLLQGKNREEPETESSQKNAASISVYPNPFNPETKLHFDLTAEHRIRITIYNTPGQRITQLCNRIFAPGNHEVIWNAAEKPSGTYLAVFEIISMQDGKRTMKNVKLALVK